jgi:hypothetical protein
VSQVLRSWWWVLFPVAAVVLVFLRIYAGTDQGALRWDELKLRLLGDVVEEAGDGRFCRTLGTLLKSGVPFLQALGNAKDVIGNRIMAGSVESVTKNVREGRGMAGPLMEAGVFPQLALSMIKVGEETGQLDSMLLKVAATYEKALRDAVKRFMSLLEPAIILGMGIIIAFIVVSMLMAVFSILELPFESDGAQRSEKSAPVRRRVHAHRDHDGDGPRPHRPRDLDGVLLRHASFSEPQRGGEGTVGHAAVREAPGDEQRRAQDGVRRS